MSTMDCICFATLQAASLGTIPSGTPAVMIEQKNSNSAVSHALYIPTGLISAPPHVLYFKNGTTYWVIHPDYVSLEAAGAPPVGAPPPTDDCATAMQNVLNYLAWAQQAKLQLWERDYVLRSVSTLTQPSNVSTLSFTVQGRGRGVSRLVVPFATGAQLGAFAITFTCNDSSFFASGFSVIAAGATASNSGCGTAMLVNFPGVVGGQGPGTRRAAIITHVEIGNDHVQTNGVSWSYFAKGIDLTGAGHPLVFDVTFAGPDGPNAIVSTPCGYPDPIERNYADESPAFLATCHLIIDGCYDPHLNSLKLWHAQTAISHVTTGITLGDQGPQGFYMSDVRCTEFKNCLMHSQTYTDGSTVQCPDGMIQNCFFQFRDEGLNLTSVQQWQVSGCEFYMLGDGFNVGGDCAQKTAMDIGITDADTVAIAGCRFNRTSSAYNAPNRINIAINPVVTPSNIEAKRFIISHNQFGDTAASGNFGVSAVKVLGTAGDIQIGHNDYIGTYTGPVVDDQTGTGAVVATLGYPGSASAPSAVVPNGAPTLGSAGAPWPASFSNSHTLPVPKATAAAPASGWVLYTDPNDLNKLKARYKDGTTIVTLGTPGQ